MTSRHRAQHVRDLLAQAHEGERMPPVTGGFWRGLAYGLPITLGMWALIIWAIRAALF